VSVMPNCNRPDQISKQIDPCDQETIKCRDAQFLKCYNTHVFKRKTSSSDSSKHHNLYAKKFLTIFTEKKAICQYNEYLKRNL